MTRSVAACRMPDYPTANEHRGLKKSQRKTRVMARTTARSGKAKDPALKVWLDDPAFGALQEIGSLHKVGPGQFRFRYDPGWLKNPAAFMLDPELLLDAG